MNYLTYKVGLGSAGLPHWVSPFGNRRIKACWRLPDAYRSLLRPSSAESTKASSMCFIELLFGFTVVATCGTTTIRQSSIACQLPV